MANKVKFGFKNCYYATITESGGSITYGTPVQLKGAVSMSLTPSGDTTEFYADDSLYFSDVNNNGYEGTLELALVPDDFKIACLGATKDTNDVLIEDADVVNSPFALLCEFTGDQKERKFVFYNCMASRPDLASSTKGESVADTAKVISCYADIIAMRTPKEGSALVAENNSKIPVINAGDGGHFHPTQTLADLLTIKREKGDFSGLTVGFCGDLKFGRTVHSLISALSRYENIKIVLISPDELKVPENVRTDLLERNGIEFIETNSLEEAMPQLDILYMTRVQRERFFNEEDYLRLKDSYILTVDKLENAKQNLSILHPLPRVNEISVAVDEDPRACYFKQVLCGKYMRMALILKLLGV